MVCPIVAVAAWGFMSCATAGQPPLLALSPADTRQQYTIVEPGKSGFCVAGTALYAAQKVNWEDVRPYLEAHAEPCQANHEPEQGLLSRVWHGYWDSTPDGEAENAVDHRIEYTNMIEVPTKGGNVCIFPLGTSVEVMTHAVAEYYIEEGQPPSRPPISSFWKCTGRTTPTEGKDR
jgi:hypothetical protein